MRPGLQALGSTADAIEFYYQGAAVVGTPDDLVERILEMQEITGGFGVMMGFVNDWADPEATRRSWDLVARHVMPEVNGQLVPMRESNVCVQENRQSFVRAGEAIMAKIMDNDRAAAALKEGGISKRTPIAPHHAPATD